MSEDGPTGQAEDFFALARALRAFKAGPLDGRPSDRALAEAADVSATTIGDWLRGTRFPQDIRKILTVVRMVRDAAARRGITSPAGGPAGLLEEACWRQAWQAEAERRAGTVSSAVQRGQADRALAPPPAGRPLAKVRDPFALEVHRPVQPEDAPPGLSLLPPYVMREHDQVLAQVVRAAAGGRSGIAVLVGESSTGKTRACWQALALLRDQDPPWRLWHPIDPSRPDAALAELPGIGPRTVVWLNEAQFYLDPAEAGLGERVAAGLRELLRDPGRAPVLVLATLWPWFWDTLTARPPNGDDHHAQARELLAGHDNTVPAALTPAQVRHLTGAEDPRLALAAAAAEEDGQVFQFLAGAPELLARYRNAPPAAAALIPAAMDARRLGMGVGLPQAFLEAAAPGYLTDDQWDALGEEWLEQALAYTAVSCKGARGPLTRIRPRPASRAARDRGDQPASMPAAAGPLYRLADYLDQHGRRTRQDQLEPPSLWDAFTTHAASASSLITFGLTAQDRGLYRHAVALWTAAATLGSTTAASLLVDCLSQASPGDAPLAARWAASHVSFADPLAVTDLLGLLEALREAGAGDAVTILAARAADQVGLDHAHNIGTLLAELREAGASAAVHTLTTRVAQASSHDPSAVTWLLRALHESGASAAVTTLAARAADQVSPHDPRDVAGLLRVMREAGASDAVTTLATRAVDQVGFDDLHAVAELLDELAVAGLSDEVTALASRAGGQISLDDTWGATMLLRALYESGASAAAEIVASRAAAQISLDEPSHVAMLLTELREAGASDAVHTLLARDPAVQVSLDYPWAVAVLVYVLRESGGSEAAHALIARVGAQTSLNNVGVIAELLEVLREAGAVAAVRMLVSRDPAAQGALERPWFVAMLLDEVGRTMLGNNLGFAASDRFDIMLGRDTAGGISMNHPWMIVALVRALREAGASDAVTTLAARAADQVSLDEPRAIGALLVELREAGASDAVTTLAARMADQVSLDDPYIAWLLKVLREAGASDAVTTLAARAADQVSLDDPHPVAMLLWALREAGAAAAIDTLLNRDPAAHVSLDDPSHVAHLLEVLREAGAKAAIHTLLDRDPAAHVGLENPGDFWVSLDSSWGVPALLRELGKAGASDAVTALAKRAANAGMFNLFLKTQPNQAPSYSFGREPDGTPSQPWRWQEPTSRDCS